MELLFSPSPMHGSYNLSLVALSVLIAMLASYVALDLAERVAVARAQASGSTNTWRVWLVAGAVAMGIGIWSMHFVGMLAFSLPAGMAYNGWLVALSVTVAILASGVALGVTSKAALRLKTLLLAGFAMGIAIAGMHYIGMAAMQVDAILTYDPVLFALSVAIAITASIVALWLAFTLRRDGEEEVVNWWIRVGAAMVMGIAIAGMHYTGMAAARFAPMPEQTALHGMHMVEGGHLAAIGIAAATFLLLAVALVSSLLDRREQRRLRHQLRAADADLAEQTQVLEKTTAQLLHAQKMESVGQLAGGIAHDFNNLLTAILNCSEFAADQLPPDSPVQNDIRQIQAAAGRAATLVHQLLAFSRRQVSQPRLLELKIVLKHLLPMLRRLVPEDVTLVTKFTEATTQVSADPVQIEQVLVNLIVNARDAMPDGGTLTIEVAQTKLAEDRTGWDAGMSPGEYVLLTVSDTGIGMDSDTQARIFEPFFTTKEQGKGTGLGLASVYGIVKQSGGSVSVYSALSEGTRFNIYLPSQHGLAEDIYPTLPSPASGGPETILVVDDDSVIRSIAGRVLTRAGYQILEATNGVHALEVCKQYEYAIHLILSDIVMPEMRGPELGRRIGILYPGMKILFMSAYAQEFNTGNGELNVPFLGKPFTPQSLTRKVRETLDAPVSSHGSDGAVLAGQLT